MTREEQQREKVNPLDLLANNVNEDDDDDDEEDDEDYCPSEDEEAAGDDEDREDDLPAQDNQQSTTSTDSSNGLLQLTDEKKKRAEELWAELNSLSRPKKITTESKAKSTTVLSNDIKVESSNSTTTNSNSTEVTNKSDSGRQTAKVSKVYDFAGESVVVEEEVAIKATKTESKQDETKANEANRVRPLVPPKRASGLGSLVSSLTKKPKMSTLTKTKLDWDSFKKDEGLEDELRNHRKNKDNFVDKQAFLLRADLKQFEQEKAIREKRRLTQSK